MKITIAANIYPPEIGGPAEYSRKLYETLLVQEHHASVVTYGGFKKYSTGVRHILYFFKLCYEAYDTDFVIAMDIFSVGLPAVAFAKLFGKKIVIRAGGDFLWETWTERTKKSILLSEFYTAKRKLSTKEKIIFWLSGMMLRAVDTVVFSTEWQKNIFLRPYKLDARTTRVIENYYAPIAVPSGASSRPAEKIFLSPSRDRFVKNKKVLEKAFDDLTARYTDIILDTKIVAHEVLQEKIGHAYAVVVPSLSEVSPNLVLDAIASGLPSVVTHDVGIADRITGMVVFVDSRSEGELAQAIESLLDPSVYLSCTQAIGSRTFFHSWNEIVQEFIDIYESH